MATILSTFATRVSNTNNSACAGTPAINQFYVDLKAADLIANNVIDLGILPAGHTITSATLIPDDLDTGTTITLDVGIMSGVTGDAVNARTVGTELFAATTAAQAGTLTVANAKSSHTIAATGADRSIGVKIVAAPTGATAGRLRLNVTAVPANSGFQY